jgi:lipopolysaccharide/colanic/teichoic acid biosynthesis glycosyltransferase
MYNFFKRLLDITVSFLTLIILLPVFIPIIIILRLSAEGEVFYFQERYGFITQDSKYGNLQQCLKTL